MKQPATSNPALDKHALGSRILYFIFFLAFVILPLQKAHAAANFSCVAKDVTSSHAILTITETTGKYKIFNFNFFLIQNNVNPNGSFDPSKISAGSDAKQQIYDFENLPASGDYAVVAGQASTHTFETIDDCAFVTPASATAPTPTAPATTTHPTNSTPPASNDTAPQTTIQQPATSTPKTSTTSTDAATVGTKEMGLVPCDGDDCTINSVVQLMNNIMNFFFKVLLLPIFVIMILYLGYQYLTAGGKPGMHAKLGKMAMHMVGGLVLILCAWLIVKAILAILGYSDPFGFFG